VMHGGPIVYIDSMLDGKFLPGLWYAGIKSHGLSLIYYSAHEVLCTTVLLRGV